MATSTSRRPTKIFGPYLSARLISRSVGQSKVVHAIRCSSGGEPGRGVTNSTPPPGLIPVSIENYALRIEPSEARLRVRRKLGGLNVVEVLLLQVPKHAPTTTVLPSLLFPNDNRPSRPKSTRTFNRWPPFDASLDRRKSEARQVCTLQPSEHWLNEISCHLHMKSFRRGHTAPINAKSSFSCKQLSLFYAGTLLCYKRRSLLVWPSCALDGRQVCDFCRERLCVRTAIRCDYL